MKPFSRVCIGILLLVTGCALDQTGKPLEPVIPEVPESQEDLTAPLDDTVVFDWRNIHGHNWHSAVKSQSCCDFGDHLDCVMDLTYCDDQGGTIIGCGSCYSFGVIGTMEALYNVYYNQKIDLNLSEQELVSCTPNGGCDGGGVTGGSDYAIQTGIVNESCFPYIAADAPCETTCPDGLRWKIGGVETFDKGVYRMNMEYRLKKYLIEHGPLHMTLTNPHVVVLSGFGYDEEGPYWIVKNSGGTDDPLQGFRIKRYNTTTFTKDNKLSWRRYIQPIPPAGIPYNRQCTDRDWDGYCWWGVGERPPDCADHLNLGDVGINCCASYCAEEPDCNDGDNSIQTCTDSELLCGSLPLLKGGEDYDNLFGSYYHGDDLSCCGDNPGEEFARNGLCCNETTDWGDSERGICRENPKIVIRSGTTPNPTIEQDLLSISFNDTPYFVAEASYVDAEGGETPCSSCTFDWHLDGVYHVSGSSFTPGKPLLGMHEVCVFADDGVGLSSNWSVELWTGVTRITKDERPYTTVDVFGDLVAYADFFYEYQGDYYGNIYLYDRVAEQETLLTPEALDSQAVNADPEIFNNQVVWVTSNKNHLAWLYDYAAGTTQSLSSLTAYHDSIDFYGYTVTWEHNDQIVLHDLIEETDTTLSSVSGKKPSLGQHLVAWQGDDGQAYVHNLLDGSEKAITSQGMATTPDVYAPLVVWSDDRNGVLDLFLYQSETETETRIAPSSSDQAFPQVFGERIAWLDNRITNRPAMYNLFFKNTLAGEQQLLTYFRTITDYALDKDQIAFILSRNNQEDIYLLALPPSITCAQDQQRGDVDNDGDIDEDDLALLNNAVIGNGALPHNPCCTDINQDGLVDIDDVVFLSSVVSGTPYTPDHCRVYDCGSLYNRPGCDTFSATELGAAISDWYANKISMDSLIALIKLWMQS